MVDDAMPRRLFEEDDDFQFSAITNRKRGSIEPSSAASAPSEKTKKKKVRFYETILKNSSLSSHAVFL